MIETAEVRFAAGDKVLVDHAHHGTVRFVGPIATSHKSAPPVLVGVELEAPIGSCDGSHEGVVYFRTAPMKGVFVKPNRVTLAEEAEEASEVWNQLDNHNEQLSLQRALQFRSVFGAEQENREAISSMEEIISSLSVPAGYDGPQLQLPVDVQQVLQVLERFKEGKKMHAKYAMELLLAAGRILEAEPNVQEIDILGEGKLTVVGDTHGQLQDLYSIFTINGVPSPENQYLFNGDFVDRGGRGVEVLLSILAFKLLYPDAVFLNRGNHESRQQNRTMGFEEEVLSKFEGVSGRHLLLLVHHVFDQLPLCAVIKEKIFVVHGGLFHHDGIELAHLQSMDRKREPPIHSPTFEDQLFEAMLWSDPRPTGGRQSSARGAGVEFGEDVTFEFLRTNRMALVIRSHECVREGFELLHAGRLITLFSASRYCGLQTNKGAFLTIGAALQPEIQQFYAHDLSDAKFEIPASLEMQARLEDNAVDLIIEQVVDKKALLYAHFARADASRTGRVTPQQWADGMRQVLELDLPFQHYQARLLDADADGGIDYAAFLERYEVAIGGVDGDAWQSAIMDEICSKMVSAMGAADAAAAFRVFDKDGSGAIDYDEFSHMLRELDVGLSNAQVQEVMRAMDTDANGQIDLQEVEEKFDGIFERHVGGAAAAEQDGERLRRVSAMILLNFGADLPTAFRQMDAEGVGHIANEALFQGLRGIGALAIVDNDEGELRRLVGAVDADGSGGVDAGEFEEAFRPRESGAPSVVSGSDWQKNVLQQMAIFLYQNRAHLAATFRSMDANNDGEISAEEWQLAMKKVNALFEQPLTDRQIETLRTTLDTDGDGRISYDEFVSGFRIVKG